MNRDVIIKRVHWTCEIKQNVEYYFDTPSELFIVLKLEMNM